MALVDVVGLPALVILAADDQQIVVGIDRAAAGRSDTDRRCPSRAPRHGVARHARADHIGHVRRLLGVNDHADR